MAWKSDLSLDFRFHVRHNHIAITCELDLESAVNDYMCHERIFGENNYNTLTTENKDLIKHE